jgi:uncharacterized protein YllA (UPF0747 family)
MKGQWVAPLSACGIGGALQQLKANGLADAPMIQPLNAETMRRRAAGFLPERRALLVEVLRDQTGSNATPEQFELLERLAQPDAVTVVAGHQLITGLGPLYVHAKVAETAALAAYWNERGIPTVPVFWMASEDHDADEIRRLFWRGKVQGSWAAPAAPLRSGAMPAQPVAEVVRQWIEAERLSEPVRWAAERSEDAYRMSANLADATRKLMGLWHPEVLVLDASDVRLKASAAALWDDEIRNQTLFSTRAEASQPWGGSEPPVPFRTSALFALDARGSRFSLDRDDRGQWQRADGQAMGGDFEMAQWATDHPELLSPNALLRPIYQEWILPNAAYTGGAGELAYAYQLAPYWARTGTAHGVWRLRHSGTWIPPKALKGRAEFGAERFRGPWIPEELRREVLAVSGAPEVGLRPVTDQLEKLASEHYGIPGLERSTAAWVQRMANEEARMIERVRREVAHREVLVLKRLSDVAEAMMPSGVLQERIWTHFDLVEHGGQATVQAYLEAYKAQPVWDESGWWEFT